MAMTQGASTSSQAPPERTYRLKTNKNNPEANTYDDLACFIRTINGIGLLGRRRTIRHGRLP